MKFWGLLIWGLCISYTVFPQYENMWAFGNRAGINFNTNPAQAITTDIAASEGCASICDLNGHLLFYTDGTIVWNRNNDTMPNGSNISGINGNITSSTSQGAVIIPVPGSLYKYYIFSLGSYESIRFGRLSYSVIDMSLDNGLGDVVTNIIGTIIDNNFTEHMTAVPGNNCDIWLIALSRENSGILKCFNISANGINPVPVESYIIPSVYSFSFYYDVRGYIDVSPDRKKIAIAKSNLLLYDFDVSTGRISNPVILINQYQECYGVSFSPDNSKLYVSDVWNEITGTYSLQQFDISSNDSLLSVRSRNTIYSWTPNNSSANLSVLNGSVRRAPDGKIYCANANIDRNTLGVINYPDLYGPACDFVNNGFALNSGTSSRFGLPNSNSTITEHYVRNSTYNLVCGEKKVSALKTNGIGYTWEDGTTGPLRTVDNPGVYWVKYHALGTQCVEEYTDTFKVLDYQWEHYSYSIALEYCWGDTVSLSAHNSTGANYVWNDNLNSPSREVSQSGAYWVKYHEPGNECKNYIDSFFVSIPNKNFIVDIDMPDFACQQHTFPILNLSPDYYNNFIWYWGNGDSSVNTIPQYIYQHPGRYKIMLVGAHNDICPDTAYHTLTVDTYRTAYFTLSPKEICEGEAVSILHHLTDSTLTTLYWNFGDRNVAEWKDENFMHHYQNTGENIVSLTLTPRACPVSSYTDTVIVHSLPKVDLGTDTSLCLQAAPFFLHNFRENTSDNSMHYLWSTGEVSRRIKIIHSGQYWLQVSNVAGCLAREYIVIDKDCIIDIPNAFTPNSDGANDYFFPRQLLSKGITSFRMQVFNRYGQLLFETNNTTGRGWDGKFNNQKQSAGVYVYRIETMSDNGRQETYTGNVTLIR